MISSLHQALLSTEAATVFVAGRRQHSFVTLHQPEHAFFQTLPVSFHNEAAYRVTLTNLRHEYNCILSSLTPPRDVGECEMFLGTTHTTSAVPTLYTISMKKI